MFETIYQNTIWVVEVWFLKKRSKKDGFEKFHYDFGSVRGGLNDVSSTIVVNLGVFHEEDEEEEEELEEDSEDEESDDESVEEGVLLAESNSPDQPERMMPANKIQILNLELTLNEEHKINLGSNELQNIKNGGCLTSGDNCKYFDYLGGQDKRVNKEKGDEDKEDIQAEENRRMEFGKKASKIILENKEWTDNVVSTKLCRVNISMNVECDENCKGGEGCMNKKIQKYEWKKVKRERTKGKGYGLIALEDIEKDDFIVEYIGKVVCLNPENDYAMQYKGMELYIDPSNAPGKYMNHSCIPNCRNEMWGVKGMPRLCFFAKRKTKSGEELTFNYGWELLVTGKTDLKRRGTECKCGAVNCHGIIERGIIISRKKRGKNGKDFESRV